MIDTSTPEGRQKRIKEFADGYTASGNKLGLVRIIGGSVDDFGDYRPEDAGEPPKGADING
jgi:hypothetical protein